MVCVAKKSDSRRGIQKSFERLRGSENIFVLVLQCAVHQDDAVYFQRAVRQARRAISNFRETVRARPVHGRFCNGIEIIGGHQSGGGFVVISADRLRVQLANFGGYFIGIPGHSRLRRQAHNPVQRPLAAVSAVSRAVALACKSLRTRIRIRRGNPKRSN